MIETWTAALGETSRRGKLGGREIKCGIQRMGRSVRWSSPGEHPRLPRRIVFCVSDFEFASDFELRVFHLASSSTLLFHTAEGGRISKHYDLEDRTFRFAERVRAFTKAILKTVENQEDVKQLVRASGSVGANYIEANEALSKRDFVMRVKICRKESKESRFFLRLIDPGKDPALVEEQTQLIQEAQELTNIFGAIVRKSE